MGMAAYRTPMFKETIIKAFANDGRFKDVRSDQRQAVALAQDEDEDQDAAEVIKGSIVACAVNIGYLQQLWGSF